jgi:acyl dehydratase
MAAGFDSVDVKEAMPMQPLVLGDTFVTAGRTIGEGDIGLFAGLVGDFTPVHVDESFAKTTVHGGRIAHGPHSMATAIGMFTQLNVLGERVIALLNLNWDFSGAVKIGDTVRARVKIASLRPTSKPGRNVGIFAFEVINQHEAVVQRGQMTVLLRAD